MNNIKLVVLDMAGTTIEDNGQVLESFITALNENQIEIESGDLTRWRGASKREVIRFFVERQFGHDDVSGNTERAEQTYKDFRCLLESRYTDGTLRTINGAEAVLASLREQGIMVALTTGFDRKITDIILKAVGWDKDTIDASISGDEVSRGRPAPFMIFRAMEATGVFDVRQVVNVGDTTLDIQSGKNACVRATVGVLSGAHDEEQLSQSEPTHIVQNVRELPDLIRQL